MKFLPWQEDLWLSKQGNFLTFDKLEHLLIALVGLILLHSFAPLLQQLPIVGFIFPTSLLWQMMFIRLLGISREIYDGLFPYDRKRNLVQGWSWKDLIANEAGISLAGVLIVIFGGFFQ